jgi:hypothetical protein
MVGSWFASTISIPPRKMFVYYRAVAPLPPGARRCLCSRSWLQALQPKIVLGT